MEQDELIIRLKEEFKKIKTELNFKSTYEEIDKIFYIEDDVIQKKYVSSKYSRQLCSRMTDLFDKYIGYFHNLVMPNPSSMISQTETNLFNEEEKQSFIKLMNKLMYLSTKNTLAGVKNDKRLEAEFIDEGLIYCNEELIPKMTKIMEKINTYWKNPQN